jgi:murein DD-endopeptidase MepM/ murein hydrolase activator NlpD
MFRIFLIIVLLVSSSSFASSIDRKISTNKKVLKKEKRKKETTKIKVKLLAKQINRSSKKFKNILKEFKKINKKINNNRVKLVKVKNTIKSLDFKVRTLLDSKNVIQTNIINTIIANYSSSIAINLANQHTQDELIDGYVYSILANNSKNEIKSLDDNYRKLLESKENNQKKIKELNKFIQNDQKDKQKLKNLQTEYRRTLNKLGIKHKLYQKELKKIIHKQNKLSSILSNLNILKKKEINKQTLAKGRKARALKRKRARARAKLKSKNIQSSVVQTRKQLNEKIKMNVKSIGSSANGVKVTKYYGRKTISPLKRYKIIKKFGTTYDKVYKIKLFNDSIELKSKTKNAKVYSVFRGKVVYSKYESGLLKNVVIVQHANKIHTIYSHLDKIAPTIRKGKFLKKGSVIGRVKNVLVFQATKNHNKYINPKDLF